MNAMPPELSEPHQVLSGNGARFTPDAITTAKRTSRPALSVIIPFYNGHRFFSETLQSLRNQTTQDFEVIVVNDGSTTKRSLDALAALRTAPSIRVLDCEHRGIAATRNAGALAARSDHIMFLDADDLLDRCAIEKLCWFSAIHPELAFVYSGVVHFGDSAGASFEEFDPDRLRRENFLTATCVMQRRIFLELGGNDPTLVDTWEDYEYWLRLVDRGYAGKLFAEPLFFYRRHRGGNSKALRRRAGNDGANLTPDLLARHARRRRRERPPLSNHNCVGEEHCSRPNLPDLFPSGRWRSEKANILYLMADLAGPIEHDDQRLLSGLRVLGCYVVLVICDPPAGNGSADLDPDPDEIYFLERMGNKDQQQAFLKYLMIAKAIDVVIYRNVQAARTLESDWVAYSTDVQFQDMAQCDPSSLEVFAGLVDRDQKRRNYQIEFNMRPILP